MVAHSFSEGSWYGCLRNKDTMEGVEVTVKYDTYQREP